MSWFKKSNTLDDRNAAAAHLQALLKEMGVHDEATCRRTSSSACQGYSPGGRITVDLRNNPYDPMAWWFDFLRDGEGKVAGMHFKKILPTMPDPNEGEAWHAVTNLAARLIKADDYDLVEWHPNAREKNAFTVRHKKDPVMRLVGDPFAAGDEPWAIFQVFRI